jgi:hypothetical protein
MRGSRHPRMRSVAGLLLAVLLLVPALFGGHSHLSHRDGGTPCAVCVAVSHTPGAAAPTVASPRPQLVATALVVGATRAPVAPIRTRPIGRAPPVLASESA